MKNPSFLTLMLTAALGLATLAGCSRDDGNPLHESDDWTGSYDAGYDGMTMDGGFSGGQGLPGGGQKGILTAGEWNDLRNWNFWNQLLAGEFEEYNHYWSLPTDGRVAVRLSTADIPLAGVRLRLCNGQRQVLWEAVSDVHGEASLFAGEADPADLVLYINDVQANGTPAVWSADAEAPVVNAYDLVSPDAAFRPEPKADIAFIVDATGSMGDEILFLKEDLADILNRVQAQRTSLELRTGAVFYRDEEDARQTYLVRTSPLTATHDRTLHFIKEQYADGGGDLPEAVHTALETALGTLEWNPSSRSRIAFLILDAPAHHTQEICASLNKSARSFAREGIRLIPVFCSSDDKTCEVLCRQLAILTGGTYVFLTNDSGVGESHVTPTVGQYTVEHLNDLIVRLIAEYTE